MKLYESGENYLETILMLQNRIGSVRSIDIANELGYSKPSISRAMSILRSADYIVMEKSGEIVLTETGRAIAEKIYERHLTISKFLMLTLGVDSETADEDACRIEHIISEKTFDRMREWVQKKTAHRSAKQ
ncbi:metal-dependent transcriptional regulator [Candidatus Soleaferrea massiliensis]|uniref:metal-dependent transcriptional regulator n=1 Tax=Candidatus Soleaferrea massiliensis TaxID=1470354 RepID=UPI00058F013B|nr:metal-dependent transcriptional regulator [Candidatus Soleaferrea massiliensis]